MTIQSDILTKLLSELKKNSGVNIDELTHCLPEEYKLTDNDPKFLVLESAIILIDWGLIEVYQKGKILKISELKYERRDWQKDIKFYITKQAIDMEQILGINFSLFVPSVFSGSRLHRSYFPDVFVLMPFYEQLRPIYDDHIKNVCESKKLTVGRADDFFSNGSIMSDIWTAIQNAKIIIADCTGRNPNVFYEIGIAHTLRKETILISQNIEDIPFDLRHLRTIIYEYNPRGMTEFEKQITKTISVL